MNKKNYEIQSLRGILCLFIMIYHFTCRFSQIYNNHEFYNNVTNLLGDIGLSCFLIISGFYFINPQKKMKTSEFIKNKIIRLYPEYILAITVIFIFGKLGYIGSERQATFLQYLLNIPMINIFLKVGYVDGAHWYITFLLLMTIVYSIFIKLNCYDKKEIWFINTFIIFMYCIIEKQLNISYLTSINHYVRFYLFFSSGILLRLLDEKKEKWKSIIFILNIGLLFFWNNLLFVILIILSYLVLIYALNEKISLLDKTRILIGIGDNSYLIYLIHQNIGYGLINFLYTFKIPIALIVSLTCCFIIILGYILNKFERVFMKSYLKFIKNTIKYLYNFIRIKKLKLRGANIGHNVIIR